MTCQVLGLSMTSKDSPKQMREAGCPEELGGVESVMGGLPICKLHLLEVSRLFFWLQGKCLLLLLWTDDFLQLRGFKRSAVINGFGRALGFFCYSYEFFHTNVAIQKTIMQCMENMYSGSKSSIFQQNFLSSLPNDLNIHFHSLLQKYIRRGNESEEQ